ncbi:hypothetical protein SAMN05421786_101420 [Chryseobacterium ureilyticum]|uniref:Uncharacterized protein n=1 Tax=Chryseobacterium ureilyticum TaxID=373668 RepID=A0A1N7KEK2_9FLAO|nr:hypothetical protein [Chryseobacterium ureilyticum]SIS60038.1 hypothetical protein SAMN05421786_101420 [Chryseobacterium ureilyticum]
MEDNKLTTREELKTYFETGKYPTQSQFSDLIDSLKHKQDTLSNDEMVMFANNLAKLNNGFVSCSLIDDLEISIVVSQQNREDQVIKLDNTYNMEKKHYFFGAGPYTIKAKDFSKEKLKENEYYILRYQIEQSWSFNRLYGNNLPKIYDGFEFGKLINRGFGLQITKQNFGGKVDIVNTNIKFVNNTDIPIQYKLEANYWNNQYTDKDTVTDHYSLDDAFSLYYKANLEKAPQSIECKLYDIDKDILVATGFLNAGYNLERAWGGGGIIGIRNIRIECDYITSK